MNTMELDLLIADARRNRERLDRAIDSLKTASKLYRDLSVDPDYTPSEQREFVRKHTDAVISMQRLEVEMRGVLVDLIRLRDQKVDAQDTGAGHARLFNCVRQVVSTSNVVAIPFPADHSPEAA
jgi:hypothetical protein